MFDRYGFFSVVAADTRVLLLCMAKMDIYAEILFFEYMQYL